MVRRPSASFRLSLVAVLFGLYALSMTGGARASEVERCVVRHTDPVAFDTNPLAAAHLRQLSHQRTVRALPQRVSAPTSLLNAACIVPPDFAETLLVPENVLALGGAPRAPGPSRAPPTA